MDAVFAARFGGCEMRAGEKQEKTGLYLIRRP
jgi:hypothetical protein